METHEDYEKYVYKNQKKLRSGITTGSCAAAAACAATTKLLLGVQLENVPLKTPKGITVNIPVSMVENTNEYVEFMVIKDSGDDPDVTNGAEVHVRVGKLDGGKQNEQISDFYFTSDCYSGLYLEGGKGIGRVTKEGLEQKPGQAAINVVPRQMIFDAVGRVAESVSYYGSLLILVSMPEGEKLSKRTFNPRLGIQGGLSILGTSGIIEPMSERAIVDTIEAQIRQLKNTNRHSLLVTPGNYGRGYVSDYLGLSLEDSIKSSNYIGETIDLAVSYGMEELLLVGNAGKLVKLAAGIMNTHSRIADGRHEIFAAHAALCGCDRVGIESIMNCINTDQMLEVLDMRHLKDAVLSSIIKKIDECMSRRIGGRLRYGVMLFSEHYGFLGATPEAAKLVERFRT
ncbi:MAG: cobalt-precorrin-5B (C(1))-methyltransferase CbiD [Wujia sp.]